MFKILFYFYYFYYFKNLIRDLILYYIKISNYLIYKRYYNINKKCFFISISYIFIFIINIISLLILYLLFKLIIIRS